MKVGLNSLANRDLYNEYRRRLDARAVLEHYGAQNCTEMSGSEGTTEIVHSCLLDRVDSHHTNADANPSACLAGDVMIHVREGRNPDSVCGASLRSIADIYELWHFGAKHKAKQGKGYRQTPNGNWTAVVTTAGRPNYLGTYVTEKEAQVAVAEFRDLHPYPERRFDSRFRNITVRSWDTDGDLYGTFGKVNDIWQSGVKPLLRVTTEWGKTLKCTEDHLLFTDDGWQPAGSLAVGSRVYREGRGRDRRKNAVLVPKDLRRAIGNWTISKRSQLILPVDSCYICGNEFPFEELELDHVIPVYQELKLALDITNLKPACLRCHSSKSRLESAACEKPGTQARAVLDKVVNIELLPSEMTYDMEVSDWHNYTANGLVVHNCLNVEKKLYTCYAGGWSGDLFHLIARLEGKDSLADALPVIGQFLTGATTESETFRDELDRLLARPGSDSIDLPTYHERVLRPWAVVHPYLYEERGITVEAASELQLGFDERENRIVFPHWWNGKLVGWQKRVIPARSGWPGTCPDWPKYRNSSGFPKAETLYRYDDVQHSEAVVVESPMSVAKAVSLGYGGVIATFGAKVSDYQIDLLKRFDVITVWFDSDPSGRAGERKLVEGLYRHSRVDVVIPEKDKDLGDYDTLEQVAEMIDRAVPAALRLADYGPRGR